MKSKAQYLKTKEFGMNKSIFSLALVAMLGICSLSASEVQAQQSVSGVQSQDLEALFGANANDVNVVALSEKELKDTQGEWGPAIIGGLIVLGVDKIGQNNGWWK